MTFEGESVKTLTKAFHEAVNDYLATCKELGKDPYKEFKGSFNERIKPDVHRMISIKSAAKKISLNHFIEQVLEKEARS